MATIRTNAFDVLLGLWLASFYLFFLNLERVGGTVVLGIVAAILWLAGMYKPADKTGYQLLCAVLLAFSSFYSLAGFALVSDSKMWWIILISVPLATTWVFVYSLTLWLAIDDVIGSFKVQMRGGEKNFRVSVFAELTRIPAISWLIALISGLALYSPRGTPRQLTDEDFSPLLLVWVLPFAVMLFEVYSLDPRLIATLMRKKEWLKKHGRLRVTLPLVLLVLGLLLPAELFVRKMYLVWLGLGVYFLFTVLILARLSGFACTASETLLESTPAPIKPSFRKDIVLLFLTAAYVSTVAFLT